MSLPATNHVDTYTFKAMASDINITLVNSHASPAGLNAIVEETFRANEQSLTRFNASSELSKANQNLNETIPASATFRGAILAAHCSYLKTEGLFDPRILTTLTNLGYTKTFKEISKKDSNNLSTSETINTKTKSPLAPWKPIITDTTINIGDTPIDLGGIGKGYTVDQTIKAIRDHSEGGCIEAGGDLYIYGPSPEGDLWKVGIENPDKTSSDPVAVLAVTNTAIATSSTSVRTWTHNGIKTHHIIDPRTGQPATTGLAAVTVLASTVVEAETLTKMFFLMNPENISEYTAAHNIPALWIADTGEVAHSPALKAHIIWQAF